MPELPDITVYIEALERRILGKRLAGVRVVSPFLLRTVEPPLAEAAGKEVTQLRRLGKRICIGLEGELWLVLHLMIAGRLHWKAARAKLSRQHLAGFDFEEGTLTWTEAGSKKRASLHTARGEQGLRAFDAGGLEVMERGEAEFAAELQAENHTLKRALTQKLKAEEVTRLYESTRQTLREWTERLRAEAAGKFPENVTAFRPEMAVHGKHKQACPRCGGKVQRIKYAANETDYCPGCQTGGKLLADRAFSRLLREDWPRTPEELESKMKSWKRGAEAR